MKNFLTFLFICASFSHIFSTLLPHLELIYDLDDLPNLISSLIKPCVNSYFDQFPIGSDPYTFSFTNANKNYTAAFSNINLKNLIIDWNHTEIIPSDNNSFSLLIKNLNSSIHSNYHIYQVHQTPVSVGEDESNPFIFNLTLYDILLQADFVETTNNSYGFIVQIKNLSFIYDQNLIFSSTIRSSTMLLQYFNDLFINEYDSLVKQLKTIIISQLNEKITDFFVRNIVSLYQTNGNTLFENYSLKLDSRISGCPQINNIFEGNSSKYIIKVPVDFILK